MPDNEKFLFTVDHHHSVLGQQMRAQDLLTLDLTNIAADPATDILIAEQVMGWHAGAMYDGGRKTRWFDGVTCLDSEHATLEGDGGGDYYYPDEAWSPTTVLVAAFEVADKIGDMTLRKTAKRDTSGGVNWGCYFERERNLRRDLAHDPRVIEDQIKNRIQFETPYHYADTAPLAISRAALVAVRLARMAG
jgi:ABA sandwich protein